MDVEVLMKKGQRGAAAYIQECCRSSRVENLNKLLDTFLDPSKSIDEWETIEWLRWLMAGGCTPDEFAATVRRYDNATTCGLVWTVNFVAYRCRTCGISPCMSLCGECFQRGNHKGHDFNMFRSQAGGACDCGDTNVMKESGFCYLHGPHAEQHDRLNDQSAPPDLLCVANAMMPRLFLRLIQLMRQHCGDLNKFMSGINAGDKFITMLHDMSSMGAAMRQVMTLALTNPQIYKRLTEVDEGSVTPEYYQFMMETKRSYEEALTSFPNAEAPEEYKDIPSLQKTLVHKSFLEEFVFWTAKFEFPQKVVVLLLNLLPDNDYKEAFTRAFVLHYSRISQLLLVSKDPDTLSNRVVHVSVQLFSNEKLALRMTEQLGLLHVMVISLKCMMAGITKPCTLSKSDRNMARVVDCADPVMKNHCYWPLVSDLNNILSHRPVAIKFLEDDGLLKMWFDLISLFQGMNVNIREMNQHVEYEPNTYYAAFSAELEASASPMWALISHLKDSSTAHLTKNLLRHCRSQLRLWLESVSLEVMQSESVMQISFHLPLHRYFSVFLYQAVRHQGLLLPELLPPPQELKAIVFHPLRVQAGFYEILSGLWVRNGLQMKGQAMTYIQCHFCNSMVDADLFLLQVAMMNLPHGEFLNSVFERFHVLESLSISSSVTNCFLEPEHEMPMMDNCLLFLATLASVRTSIGMSESDLFTLEMITLLCMGDKTHSLLIELMPERCGNSSHTKDFESVLSKVAEYKPPHLESSGLMSQGTYVPKPFVWETLYDPIYLLLRAVHRKEFQNSLDRFTEFAKHTGKFKGSGSLWPPYRIPTDASEPYTDPRHILLSKVLQGVLFVIFYKAVNTSHLSDQVVALAVYLLEMALSVCDSIGPQVICPHEISYARIDTEFASWYKTDCLLANLRTEIDSVYVKTNPSVTSDSSEDVSVDDNMEVESYDGEVDMYDSYDSGLIALISSTTDYPMAESHSSGISHSHQPLAIMPNTVAESSSPSMLVPLPERPSRPPPALAMSPAAIAATSSTPQITTSVSLPALPPPSARPSGGSEEEVAVATSTGVRMDEIQRQRGLQVVLAPAKPLATVPKKELVERNSSMNNRDAAVEVVVNESMISLLLKLHSKLSSCPDSYVPFWEQPEALKIIEDAKAGLDSRLTIHIIPVDSLLASSSSGSGSSSDTTGGAESSLFRLPGQSPDQSPNQTLIDSETEFHEFSYSQLYSILNPSPNDPISRIGDGPFFVGKLLNQIAAKDDACREAIVSTRSRLWPRTTENADELKLREQREKELRRKAMERRQKLLAEMHRMQEKFMENFGDGATGAGAGGSSVGGSTDNIADSDNEIPEETIKPVEYDCVICNQTSPSTADNPMGLVILLQSSSTLGHRRKKGSRPHRLPTNDEEKHKLTAEDTMTYYNEQRLEEFSTHFDDSSWLLSISGGWEGGVHVQTCGHHLHMECLVGYLSALRSQQKQHSVAFDRGEYSCPLCRQLANSFIPLSPEFGIRQSALVKDRKNPHHHAPLTPEITVPEIPPSPEANVALEVMKLLREYPFPTPAAKITDAITKTMEEMTNATMLKYRQIGHSKNSKSISLFVSSIARSNLEIEIVTRGGNLVSVQTEPQPSTSSASTVSPTAVSKRSCIVPLLYVLGYHYKILSAEPCSSKLWERILGIRFLPDSSLMPVDREVPMLLRDPCTILLHLLMQLPVHVDLAYFTEMVQGIYNLVYVQILCGLSCRFSEKERENWKTRTSMLSRNTPGDFNELNVLFGHIIRYLESSPLYIPDSDYGDRDYESKLKDKKDMGYTERELDSKIQGLLLPYLRVAALLRHQIYEQELPFISTKAEEFGFLARFLCLGGREQRESTGILGDGPAMDDYQDEESLLDVFKAHKFLQWISPTPLTAIWTWCEDLISFIVRARSSASYLIETHHVLWDQPRLLDLPHAYDDIFQFYHRKACPNCGQVPKDPNVCLVCGMLVCMRDSCCKQPNGGVCEAIQHSVDCGAGTAIFLSVNLSTIVVVRGRRACLWGSVYLDRFGEEDRDLKRGRPLFLSKERYALLNQQWISHRFDHTNRKWIWHRDGL